MIINQIKLLRNGEAIKFLAFSVFLFLVNPFSFTSLLPLSLSRSLLELGVISTEFISIRCDM